MADILNDALKEFIETKCPNIDSKSPELTHILIKEIAKLKQENKGGLAPPPNYTKRAGDV